MDNLRIFVPVIDAHPHLKQVQRSQPNISSDDATLGPNRVRGNRSKPRTYQVWPARGCAKATGEMDFQHVKKCRTCNLKRKRKQGGAGSPVRAIIFFTEKRNLRLTFLNVLNPARIDPPIHVLYFRSGGANILIFISLTARRRTSERRRSPNPLCVVTTRSAAEVEQART